LEQRVLELIKIYGEAAGWKRSEGGEPAINRYTSK